MIQENGGLMIEVRLEVPYEQALERVVEALKNEGFGVLTSIDVQRTLAEKLNADFRKYTILGACNPPLAHQALSADLGVGLLLPCNVIVYEQDGGSVVGLMDPLSMLGMIKKPELEQVALRAKERLERVAKALQDYQ